jgi:hypothetical protein
MSVAEVGSAANIAVKITGSGLITKFHIRLEIEDYT